MPGPGSAANKPQTLPILARLSAALGLGLALLPGTALAQAYQCRAPASVGLSQPVKPDGPVIRKPIAGYTLALSWSPEYCRSHRSDPGNAVQCGGGAGRGGSDSSSTGCGPKPPRAAPRNGAR